MKISVVICTRDRHDLIGQAIESVSGCDYPRFDIHIMDQSTNTLTREITERLAEEKRDKCVVHYHHLTKAGLSRAYNTGIKVSDGEVIAFTDDDCIVPADWLTRIAEAFENDPEVGLLYGQVLTPASLYDDAMSGKIIVPELPFKEREKLARGRGFKVFGMGANMAMRRSLAELTGGFDEALGGGGPLRSAQDYDFAYRTFRFGSAVLLEPAVKADHYGTRLPEQWPVTMQNYGIGDGAFYAKHIRCGDFLAAKLLAKLIVRSWARELRSFYRTGSVQKDPYGRFLLQGVKEASRFAIDPKYRLYRETERGKMTVTNANAVTAASAAPGASVAAGAETTAAK
jgi:glycosyltransferase involved in cell wall biosynthesis